MPYCSRPGSSPGRKSFFKLQIAIVALGIFTTACEPNELRPVPIGFPNSEPVSPVSPIRPQQPATKPNQNARPMPMIDNPDAEVEYDSEEIWADDEYTAQRECERLAQSRSDRSVIVTVEGKPQKVTKKPSKTGSFRFVCRFRIEHQ